MWASKIVLIVRGWFQVGANFGETGCNGPATGKPQQFFKIVKSCDFCLTTAQDGILKNELSFKGQ